MKAVKKTLFTYFKISELVRNAIPFLWYRLLWHCINISSCERNWKLQFNNYPDQFQQVMLVMIRTWNLTSTSNWSCIMGKMQCSVVCLYKIRTTFLKYPMQGCVEEDIKSYLKIQEEILNSSQACKNMSVAQKISWLALNISNIIQW